MTNSIILILLIIILAPVILIAGFIALAVAITILCIPFVFINTIIFIIWDKIKTEKKVGERNGK